MLFAIFFFKIILYYAPPCASQPIRVHRNLNFLAKLTYLLIFIISIRPKKILNCFSGQFFRNTCGRSVFIFIKKNNRCRNFFFKLKQDFFLKKVVLWRLFHRIAIKPYSKASAHHVDLTPSSMHKTYTVETQY